MFGSMTDASKVALLYLCAYLDHWKYALIDTQLPSSSKEEEGERKNKNTKP